MLSAEFMRNLARALWCWGTAWQLVKLGAVGYGIAIFPWGSTLGVALLLATLFAYYYLVAAAPVQIYSSNTPGEMRMLRRLECAAGRGYWPCPLLVNANMQTLFAGLGRPMPSVPWRRELAQGVYTDGEVCVLDWAFGDSITEMFWQSGVFERERRQRRSAAGGESRRFANARAYNAWLSSQRDDDPFRGGSAGGASDASAAARLQQHNAEVQRRLASGRRPIVIIFHGLTGGSEDNNVYHVAKWLLRKGWHVVVPVRRGCADSAEYVTVPKHYAYGGLEDTEHVVNFICDAMPDFPILAVGLSAGSNVMSNYIAVHGRLSRILGAVSIANGFCWERGTAAIRDEHPVWDVVMSGIVNNTLFVRHKDVIAGSPTFSGKRDPLPARQPRGMREYDERISMALHGFEDLSEFYVEQSCVHRLHKVKVPTIFLNALDDPIASGRNVPYDGILRNPNTLLVVTPSGGHLGWAEGLWPFRSVPTWMDRFVLQALDAVLHEVTMRKDDPPGRSSGMRGNDDEELDASLLMTPNFHGQGGLTFPAA